MAFNPEHSIQAGLKVLSERLDPIIAAKLTDVLNGLPWTMILQELDEQKGFSKKEYQSTDLQPQLRMLTERLGGLKYPFDDPHTRIVSTLASYLRIVRNQWAHNSEFTMRDAWRMHDHVAQLLDALGDEEGAQLARSMQERVFHALAKDKGYVQQQSDTGFVERSQRMREGEDLGDSEPDDQERVVPSAEVRVRPQRLGDEEARIGLERAEFEPWLLVEAGEPAVLDDLPKKEAKNKVRAIAREIAEVEGPVHIERLARRTAAAFGMRKLYPKRMKQLQHQAKVAEGLSCDDEKFVWPGTIDPDTWNEFRPSTSDAKRPFVYISPREIANAIDFLRGTRPNMSGAELETAVLQTFGRKRRTKKYRNHIKKALVHTVGGDKT